MPARSRPGLVATLALLLTPSLSGWDMTGPQTTMVAEGPMARMQYDLFMLTVWVGVFIFVAVGLVLAWVQWRYRARPGTEGDPVPEQTHGKPLVEVGLILASVGLLVIIGIPTLRGIRYMGDNPMDEPGSYQVQATGYQWWFKFDYPAEGFATANELIIPAGRKVRIDLRTMDVIHSFWIPRLAGKIDMIRNRPNWMWLQADQPGYYWGHCAEFCGDSHAYMRFRVVALAEPEFSQWVARQKAEARSVDPKAPPAPADAPVTALHRADISAGPFFAAAPAGISQRIISEKYRDWQTRQHPYVAGENASLVAEGRELFGKLGCSGCHAVRGHGAAGISAPDLTHFASRTTLAAAVLEHTPANVKRWILQPNEVKPGNLMWLGYSDAAKAMTDAQADALVAYLESLR